MSRPTGSPPAADFASGAMVRLLAQGMRDLGMQPPLWVAPSSDLSALVALDQKRQLVASAIAQGGVQCLAFLGRGLRFFAHEPTHRALVSARNANDLFMRWSRLERYIHSRHRIKVLMLSDRDAAIAHQSLSGYSPPLPAENLVVLGVLAALLEAIGAKSVIVRIGEVPVYPEPDVPALEAAVRDLQTATWFLSWDEVTTSENHGGVDASPLPMLAAPQTWSAPAQRTFLRLVTDLPNPLTLPALAEALGEAPRSLQRALNRDGRSYTGLLGEARCQSAAWWLLHTRTPIAEVGFACGYADQPHFTRDFRNRIGTTPLLYRVEFTTLI